MIRPLYKTPLREWPSKCPVPQDFGEPCKPRPLQESDFENIESHIFAEREELLDVEGSMWLQELRAITNQWDFTGDVPYLICDKDAKLRAGPYPQGGVSHERT